MNGPVILDTNLLLLLVVGTTSPQIITLHKRLAEFSGKKEFNLLVELIGLFSDIMLLPHIVAETSSLLRQIRNPIRARVQDTFRRLITATIEIPVSSVLGARRDEYQELGITDAVILHALTMDGLNPTLLTIDERLALRAESLGYSVINCRREFWPDRF